MTARSTASVNNSPYISSFYRWWSPNQPDEKRIATEFGSELIAHFDYLRARCREIEYPLERLNEHQAMVREYFRISDAESRVQAAID
jgi:hypothetical protein